MSALREIPSDESSIDTTIVASIFDRLFNFHVRSLPSAPCSGYLLHRCIAEKTTATRNCQPDHRRIVRKAFRSYDTPNLHSCLSIFHLLADDWRISRSRGTAICREEDRSWIKRPDYKRPINFFILFAPRTKNRASRYCCDRFFSPGRILFISLAAANQRFRWLSRAA